MRIGVLVNDVATEQIGYTTTRLTALLPWDSRCGPRRHSARPDVGSPSSRPESFRACLGSKTARGPDASRDNDAPGSAFRTWEQRRHPEWIHFRGSMSGLHVPLLTLRPYPCGHVRIARGQCRFATAPPYGSLIRCSPSVTGASPKRPPAQAGRSVCTSPC